MCAEGSGHADGKGELRRREVRVRVLSGQVTISYLLFLPFTSPLPPPPSFSLPPPSLPLLPSFSLPSFSLPPPSLPLSLPPLPPLCQDIVPRSTSNGALELFVPPSKVEQAKAEAESLPKLTLTKLDTQWLQVRCLVLKMEKLSPVCVTF